MSRYSKFKNGFMVRFSTNYDNGDCFYYTTSLDALSRHMLYCASSIEQGLFYFSTLP